MAKLVAGSAGGGTGDQTCTIEASGHDDGIIMLTFNNSGGAGDQSTNIQLYESVAQEEHKYAEDVDGHREMGCQTETVFGLRDLPVVKEIVSKKMQEKRKMEEIDVAAMGPKHGIYTCLICARVYRNKVSWQNHLQTHNGDEIYMCGVCGSLFDRKITLKAHLDIHIREEKRARFKQHKHIAGSTMKIGGVFMPGDLVGDDSENEMKEVAPPVLEATIAPSQPSQNLNLNPSQVSQDHQLMTQVAAQEVVANNYEEEPIEDKINQALQGLESMENEPETDDGSSYIYACNICGAQYSVKADCEAHLAVHTQPIHPSPSQPAEPTQSTPTQPTPTQPSQLAQPERPELQQQTPLHIVSPQREVPKTVDNTPSPDKHLFNNTKTKFSAYIYACNVCGKQYTNKSNCKRHMRIHTDEEKNFECETCGKRFAQKYEVKMHSRIHTGEKPYQCAVCGKNFTERGNWRRHTQIHVKPQEASPYRCGICCKGFFNADKLQIHLQIHSGQRPFICTVCGRKAKKIGDMYRHLRTHTGEKPYKCQVCGKGFAQNGNLKDHMKMHTGEKPHECDLCGKTFSRKILLKEHVKNHHKGTTLKDLTEAALEEIERQEAKLDSMETEEDLGEAVVHELGAAEGRIFIVKEEDAVLDEEQELELQDVQSTLTEKELEAAHVLTVVQDAESLLYSMSNANNKKTLTEDTKVDTIVQNA